jgi:hypothetical protein
MYGPVQDVRIPYQQKRMFGFVTFVYAETVKIILSKGNPHFVCDARVLVKPYKEKGKVPDRFRSVASPASHPSHRSSDPPTYHIDSFRARSKRKHHFFSGLVAGSCSTRTTATSPAARRPPDCWIPGTPSTCSNRRLVRVVTAPPLSLHRIACTRCILIFSRGISYVADGV